MKLNKMIKLNEIKLKKIYIPGQFKNYFLFLNKKMKWNY